MDPGLVLRAQRGDREAYEMLARSSARSLYATAHRIVRDADRAEEAVQQALVAIWRELPSLRDPARFESWTYRLLVRFCLADDRRQRRTGVRMIPLGDIEPPTRDPAADVALRDQLDRALRALSVEQRAVVVLHHYAGVPLGEIAEILGVPYGTVGSRLHNATRTLRRLLGTDEPDAVAGGQPA